MTESKDKVPVKKNKRRSWQQWDVLCFGLAEPHETDQLTFRQVVDRWTEGRGPPPLPKDAPRCSGLLLMQQRPRPPLCVCMKGRRDDGDFLACVVYCGRAQTQGGWQLTDDSIWANPCRAQYVESDPKGQDRPLPLDELLRRYERHLKRSPDRLLLRLHELAGKQIGCFCPQPRNNKPNPQCHLSVIYRAFCELYWTTSDDKQLSKEDQKKTT